MSTSVACELSSGDKRESRMCDPFRLCWIEDDFSLPLFDECFEYGWEEDESSSDNNSLVDDWRECFEDNWRLFLDPLWSDLMLSRRGDCPVDASFGWFSHCSGDWGCLEDLSKLIFETESLWSNDVLLLSPFSNEFRISFVLPFERFGATEAVSYTHLTLPTILLV